MEWNDLLDDDKWNSYCNFTVGIGLENKEGTDLFQLTLTTPKAQGQAFKAAFNGTQSIHVVHQFTQSAIEHKIHELVSNIEGQSWMDITNQLRKFMHWEYEGMT